MSKSPPSAKGWEGFSGQRAEHLYRSGGKKARQGKIKDFKYVLCLNGSLRDKKAH